MKPASDIFGKTVFSTIYSEEWDDESDELERTPKRCRTTPNSSSISKRDCLEQLLNFEPRFFDAVISSSDDMKCEYKNLAKKIVIVTESYSATCAGSVAIHRVLSHIRKEYDADTNAPCVSLYASFCLTLCIV